MFFYLNQLQQAFAEGRLKPGLNNLTLTDNDSKPAKRKKINDVVSTIVIFHIVIHIYQCPKSCINVHEK